jgi:hypothetical protein
MSKVTPRLISLQVDGTDRSDEISSAKIQSAASSSDFVTFAQARSGGGRDYTLAMTIAQDHASGTLWDTVFTGAGTEIPYIYAPYGNTTPTTDQPHYSGTAIVSEPDGDMFGADADASTTAVASIDVAWKLKEKPVKVTA